MSETVARPPWRDCVWATGAMLLDKWTAGKTKVSFRALHVLGGSHHSSDFADLRQAFARLGVPLTYSPNGGDFTTWPELLVRLKKGGGAILLGDDSKLPRHYGRFDPQFWRNEASSDNHALYLDGYDGAHHRVWVMDPLAPPGWTGEWIAVTDLMRYAWHTPGGGLSVAMTPTAERAPFAGVTLGEPVVAVASDSLIVSWPIDGQPNGWKLSSTKVSTTVTKLKSGIVVPGPQVLIAPPTAEASAPLSDPNGALAHPPANADVARPTAKGIVAAVADSLVASLPVPTSPGTYLISGNLVEQRFGTTVATVGPYVLYIAGDRVATIGVDMTPRSAIVGQPVAVTSYVLNRSLESWADPAPIAAVPLDTVAPRDTAIVAHWVTADPALVAFTPPPVTVEAMPLAPGAMAAADLLIAPPTQPGDWTLVLDIADAKGSFAAAGSAPASIPVTVAAAAWWPAPH